jgi:signal transduction histidine kinase
MSSTAQALSVSGDPAAPPRETPEELELRANKLELLERLADDLAHEIKNPLHSMVINLEVLRRRVMRNGGGEQDDVLRYIGVLSGELDRVNRRIELLLRLSRPGRGAESTTLGELAEELMELVQLEARHRATTVEYDPGLHVVRVHVPREPARQVILNLVLEVIDGLGTGAALRISISEEGGEARLRVTGTGAAAGEARFTSRLAVARALAEGLGGRVDPLEGAGGTPNGLRGVELVLPAARGNGA